MGKMRVAVIGAGVAGLCSARYLAAEPETFEFKVYEKTDQVGGTWVYSEKTGVNEYGLPIHSSMYPSLRTNLPKELMAFPDFPFNENLPSFIKHTDALIYLQKCAEHFRLLQYIQFYTAVESVRPITTGDKVTWDIKVRDIRDGTTDIVTYDAVVVGNGHYAVPSIPDLPGMTDFKGVLIHSHNYRHPDVFKDQEVILLGAGKSGIDLAIDIAPHASKVYLCHRHVPLVTPLPSNVRERKEIVSFEKNNEVVLADGQRCRADAVVLCTGYEFDYGFLAPECQPKVVDRRVTPLFKHVIHTTFPTLAFIGITNVIIPSIHFTAQVKFVLAAWRGTYRLPTKAQMDEEIAEDFRWRTTTLDFPPRYAHRMGPIMRDYHRELLDLAKEEQFKPYLMKMFDKVVEIMETNAMNFKEYKFQVLDDENVKVLLGDVEVELL